MSQSSATKPFSVRRGLALAATGTGVGLMAWTHDAEERKQQLSDAGLPLAYLPERIDEYWNQHPAIVTARLFTILGEGLPFLARLGYAKYTGRLDQEEECAEMAVEFRLLVTRLGPCFIKFGQMLSIRPDVLPPAAVYELQKLCDAVPPFPTAQALATVEKELGQSISDVFAKRKVDTMCRTL